MQSGAESSPNGPDSSRYVLALDLGGGSCKAAIVSDTGNVIATAEENIRTHLLPDGGAEQDPHEWWSGIRKAAKHVISQSGIDPEKIVAVGCDSQWSVVVPVNQKAEPLMNAIHWLDTRGGKYNRKIVGGFPRVEGYNLFKLQKWLRMTGMLPTKSGIDSLGHVLFIKNELPDIYTETYKFLEPMDYLTSRLTGKITATQKTMAIFTIVDNREWGSLSYADSLLRLAGVERDKFPELIPNNGVVGCLDANIAEELGLKSTTRVVAGIGDSNASTIGSGAVLDYEAIVYIGTSFYMNCHVPFKKTDIAHFIGSLPASFPNKYVMFAEQGTGGRCVEHFLKNLVYAEDGFSSEKKPEDAYERFNDMVEKIPAGSNGVVFLPWLNGSMAPVENPNMRGGFINISLNAKRGDLARSIMEGLAFNSRWTKQHAEKFTGQPINKFRFSGGGAQSGIWSQIHADILGVPVLQIDDPVNTTVRGTALNALVSLGLLDIQEIPNLIRIKKIYDPEPENRKMYNKLFPVFRNLYSKNRRIFNTLNNGD